MSLFKMWEEAKTNNKPPMVWGTWEEFRSWAIQNRYKSEYGYKGEFSPQGCLKAIPGYEEKDNTGDESLNTPTPPDIKGSPAEEGVEEEAKEITEDTATAEKGESNARTKANTRSKRSKGV